MGPTEFFRKWLCLNKRFKRTLERRRLQQLQEDRGAGLRAPPLRPHRARAEERATSSTCSRSASSASTSTRPRAPGRITAKLPIYNTEFGLQSNPPDRLVSTQPRAPGGADQREGGVRVPLLAPEEPLAVPAVRRPARGPAALSTKWSGFQTGLRFADGRRKTRLQRVPVPDRGEEARHGRVDLGPRAARLGHPLGAAAEGRPATPARG